VLADGLCPVKLGRREMIVIGGVGIPLDVDLPPGDGSGDLEVIERSAAAENHFPPGAVSVTTDSRMVGE
jgi:hypothetical protein